MPKPKRGQSQTVFSVGTWKEKKKATGEEGDVPEGHTVVVQPMTAALNDDAAVMDDVPGAQAGAAQAGMDRAGAVATTTTLAPGEWQTKKKHKGGMDVGPPVAAGGTEQPGQQQTAEEPAAALAEQASGAALQPQVSGVAYLALLPNSSITGAEPGVHVFALSCWLLQCQRNAQCLMCEVLRRACNSRCPRLDATRPPGHVVISSSNGGGKRSFGLVGEQVLSRRECTRDEGKPPRAGLPAALLVI